MSSTHLKFKNSPKMENYSPSKIEQIDEVGEGTDRTKFNDTQMKFDYSYFISNDQNVKKVLKIIPIGQNIVIGNCSSLIEEESVRSDLVSNDSKKSDSYNTWDHHLDRQQVIHSPSHIINHDKSNIRFKKVRKRLSEIVFPTKKEVFEKKLFTFEAQRHTARSFQSDTQRNVEIIEKETERAKSKVSPNKKLTSDMILFEKTDEDIVRVLLCDDENLIRKTLQRFFNMFTKEDSRLTFDVQHSKDGFECLHKIYENYNIGQYFDILIIDETMPLIKGSQIIHLLKTMMKENDFKPFTIVSFTSYNSIDKVEYILSQGADSVLSKPIDYQAFKDFLIGVVHQNNL